MRYVLRSKQRWLASLLVLILLGSVLSPTAAAQEPESPSLSVVAAALNVRQGPGISYPSLAVLQQGDRVAAIGYDPAGGWWQVQLPDSRSGWVSGGPAYVAVTGAPVVPPAATGQPVPGGTVVFQTVSGGPIYAIPAGCASLPSGCGGALRYLTSGLDPVLSPDGRQVAFTRWDNPQNGALGSLWVINVDGSGERQILGDIRQPKSPTWSPDGAVIALSMQYGGRLQPEEQCSNRRPPRNAEDISTRRGEGGDITFCYTLPPDPLWGLRRVDVATGQFEDLPRDNYSYAPTWNPANPEQLVYTGQRGLISLDLGQGVTWLLSPDVQVHTPVFSPDGSKLAVTYRQDDHWEIHVMNADGTGAARLTETSYRAWAEQQLRGEQPRSWNNAAPAWSPDGRQLIFITDRAGLWEIWVMDAGGGNQRPLFPPGTLSAIPLVYNGMDEKMLSWR